MDLTKELFFNVGSCLPLIRQTVLKNNLVKCLLCSLVLLFIIKALEISLDSFYFLQCRFIWDKISMEQNEFPMAGVTFTKDEFLALAFIGEFSISK